jgi:hypothetical protein
MAEELLPPEREPLAKGIMVALVAAQTGIIPAAVAAVPVARAMLRPLRGLGTEEPA